MRIEHWERSTVRGYGDDVCATESMIHRRNEDVLSMAIRRNKALAGCSMFFVDTEEAFQVKRDEPERRRSAEDIPRSGYGEEWDW